MALGKGKVGKCPGRDRVLDAKVRGKVRLDKI